MSQPPNYITPEGLENLRAEYRDLFHRERPQLVETIAWAAGNGDRSENGDYIYGKRRLREIDRRLRFLAQKIEDAQIVDPRTINLDYIVFGATVTLEMPNGDKKQYQIVGEDEINPHLGKISWKSPMAKALIHKKIGDEAIIARPLGDIVVEILNIEYK